MSSCIICGASVDGRICDLHEEDVVFEFRGEQPDQLTVDRFYRGTVDGFAEFGVFVDIGNNVTGLLHKSELDQRLESLDWDPGESVFVQVQNVRDNGNVDLGWSIRQGESEFRGTLIDDPDADEELLTEETETADPESSDESTEEESSSELESTTEATKTETASESEAAEVKTEREIAETTAATAEPAQVTIDELDDHVGERVRIEGEVSTARQTSGPTVFEVRDETAAVDCAAFEEAGVRAYPEAETEDVIRIEGEVERRRGELQIETEALVVLEAEEREAVTDRMQDALVQRARPDSVEPLAANTTVTAVPEALRDAATAIRRAVLEDRPVVVRHSATADGYVAGVAIERATLPLIRDHHQGEDAEYHYFDRRPLEGSVYDMDDATGDVTGMLENKERHDEKIPLFVFVAAAGTAESLDGVDLLDVYDARRVVVEDRAVDEAVLDVVDTAVSPPEEDGETTATALAANVAAHVNADVRADLEHLPAVSFWEDTPDGYLALAGDAGYDETDLREIREAVALEAFYQSYEDKRELVIDLLFADEAEDALGLAGHVSEQFRTKMDAEIETAEANLERKEIDDGTVVLVLDTDAYTHRYEFPPTPLLLNELYRRHRESADAVIGIDDDEAYVRTDAPVDVRDIVEEAREVVPGAGLDARGAREGRVEFLAGERDAAREAILGELSGALFSAAAQ